MDIKKTGGKFNDYTFEGLTEGKIIALANALQSSKEAGTFTPIQEELSNYIEGFLQRIGHRRTARV